MLKRGSIITLILVSLATGIIYLLFLLTPEPPLANLEKARSAIAEARKQGAEKYAPDLFSAAESAYDQAVELLEVVNHQFILTRNYDAVDSICQEAILQAEKATNKSLSNSKKLEVSLKARIDEMTRLVDRYNDKMNSLPISPSSRKKFLNGKMSLSEARIDYEKNNYNEGDAKARIAAGNINESIAELTNFLEDYFESYPDWIVWYQESVDQSRKQHTYLIVIDKMARACRLYKSGKLKKTYDIELGRNWIGDKKYKGDKSTPEGRYHIVKKLDVNHSKYYKALLINYPNDEDRERFERDKRNGIIPRNADIGGLIEIHGHGGKGADWTDGCIALKDEDMKDLFNHAGVQTPVTIVGSLAPLDKLLKN